MCVSVCVCEYVCVPHTCRYAYAYIHSFMSVHYVLSTYMCVFVCVYNYVFVCKQMLLACIIS